MPDSATPLAAPPYRDEIVREITNAVMPDITRILNNKVMEREDLSAAEKLRVHAALAGAIVGLISEQLGQQTSPSTTNNLIEHSLRCANDMAKETAKNMGPAMREKRAKTMGAIH